MTGNLLDSPLKQSKNVKPTEDNSVLEDPSQISSNGRITSSDFWFTSSIIMFSLLSSVQLLDQENLLDTEINDVFSSMYSSCAGAIGTVMPHLLYARGSPNLVIEG